MRAIRTLVVTLPCVLTGVLGLTGTTMAEPAPAQPLAVRSVSIQGSPDAGGPAPGGSAPARSAPGEATPDPGGSAGGPGLGEPDPGGSGFDGTVVGGSALGGGAAGGPDEPYVVSGRGLPRTSTATRHVPTPAESALTGAVHPATDRVMALLVGWVLLAVVGGGLMYRPAQGSGRTVSPRTGTSRHAATGKTPEMANAPA